MMKYTAIVSPKTLEEMYRLQSAELLQLQNENDNLKDDNIKLIRLYSDVRKKLNKELKVFEKYITKYGLKPN